MTSAIPTLFDLPGYALIALGGVADVLLVAAGGIYLAVQPGLYRRGALRLLPGLAALQRRRCWTCCLCACAAGFYRSLRRWLS